MNRTDIVKAVANREKAPAAEVERIITSLLEVIGLAMSCGEEVTLRSFGKFQPRVRATTLRKIPTTGEEVKVPEKISVAFVPSPILKKRLNKT